jgi:hypothetical protein
VPIPTLLHPVPVTVQKLDRDATVFDADYKEQLQREARAEAVICPGQIFWVQDQAKQLMPGGAREDSDGYVLFRYIDLQALDITIDREDRFTAFGSTLVDVYVVKLTPMGHYADAGGPTLVKAWFKDRQPSRQTRGG